jgi:hypothetical protein
MISITDINNTPFPLGIHNSVIQEMAKVLNKRTCYGILSVLRVNPAATVLHQLCVKNLYAGILKPIFIKAKSEKENIAAAFIHYDEAYINSLQQDYPEIKFAPVNLAFPLQHLKKLFDLGYIKFTFNNNKFKIIDKNSKVFYGKFSTAVRHSNALQNIKDEGFFAQPFYQARSLQNIMIFDNEKKPVLVLGIKLSGNNANKLWPIIADIDAHSFSQKSFLHRTSYDTHDELQRQQLQNEVNAILHKRQRRHPISYFTHKKPRYLVHKHLGHISAEEVVFYYDLNLACNRKDELLGIIQHGATAHMTAEDVAEVRHINPQTHFPAIDDDTGIAVIFPAAFNKVAYITGEHHILAFYYLMNELGHYHFDYNPAWKDGVKQVTTSDLEFIHKELIRNHILPKQDRLHKFLPLSYIEPKFFAAGARLNMLLHKNFIFKPAENGGDNEQKTQAISCAKLAY